MLVPDDFGYPQDIGAVAILDGAALFDDVGELRIAMLRDAIAARLGGVPRFRQLLMRPPRGLGVPYWADAPRFDITEHVRVRALPAGAGERELLAAYEELRRCGFDRDRPLWQWWFLPGLAGGRVGMIVRLHHTIADGVAGIATLATFLDPVGAAPARAVVAWMPRPLPTRRALLLDNIWRRLQQLCAPVLALLLHPLRSLRTLASWRPLLREMRRTAPSTSLAAPIGSHRRMFLVRGDLAACKTFAHAHHATVNDVLLAAIGGGLRELFRARGEAVSDRVVHVGVPIAAHVERGAPRGNRNSGMVVRVPLEADPVRRLRAIAADTALRKREPRAVLASIELPGAMLVLRAVARRMATQQLANMYVANVPGPPLPMYLAGARLLEIAPVVPLTGNMPLAAGALSYAGQLALAIVADDACPDADVFAAGVQRVLGELTARPERDIAAAAPRITDTTAAQLA